MIDVADFLQLLKPIQERFQKEFGTSLYINDGQVFLEYTPDMTKNETARAEDKFKAGKLFTKYSWNLCGKTGGPIFCYSNREPLRLTFMACKNDTIGAEKRLQKALQETFYERPTS